MAKRHLLPAILLASIGFIATARAEEFPNRPITWVVPFAPGGITDTTSRIVAEEMSRTLGQSVLIDNRGGGGGTVGTEQVARSKPDGYTMIYGTQGTMAANVSLRKNLSYDPLTTFLPVHLVGESPNLFVAYHDAPYNSVQEFIDYAKENPGKVTFSSSGVGTATHLVAELFKTVAGVEMQHVPYRGSAPALNDLIAGRVDVVEPTNNAAERALRHAVCWRKTSYRTDTEGGSRFVERILTVIASCRQQERHVLSFLYDAVLAARTGTKPPSLLPQVA